MPTIKKTAGTGTKGKNPTAIAPKKKTAAAKKTKKKTDPIILPVMPLLEI
jgi:hypothetical protein